MSLIGFWIFLNNVMGFSYYKDWCTPCIEFEKHIITCDIL